MEFQQETFPSSAGAALHRTKPIEVRSSLTSFVRAHSQVELPSAASQMSRSWNQQPQTRLHEGERNPRQVKPYVLLECVQDLHEMEPDVLTQLHTIHRRVRESLCGKR